jgi:hypothetical protein
MSFALEMDFSGSMVLSIKAILQVLVGTSAKVQTMEAVVGRSPKRLGASSKAATKHMVKDSQVA